MKGPIPGICERNSENYIQVEDEKFRVLLNVSVPLIYLFSNKTHFTLISNVGTSAELLLPSVITSQPWRLQQAPRVLIHLYEDAMTHSEIHTLFIFPKRDERNPVFGKRKIHFGKRARIEGIDIQ